VIKFNSRLVVGDEVVVSPGTPLVLRCEGDGPVTWHTRLAKHRRYVSRGLGQVRTFKVNRPSAEFTGTYRCVYTSGQNRMPDALTSSSVHVYVKGELRGGGSSSVRVRTTALPVHQETDRIRIVKSFTYHFPRADPNRLFWTSSTSLRVVRKEGEDCLLPCLLTDPTATDMGLRMDNGTTLPPGMNFTAFRHRGIFIHSLQPSFNADYVCTARVRGVEKVSRSFSINVIQSESPSSLIAGLKKNVQKWLTSNVSVFFPLCSRASIPALCVFG